MLALRIAIFILAVAVVYLFRVCLLALGCVVYAYLLPGVLAQKKNCPKYQRIYWVCGLSGWLIIPWIGALLWVLIASGFPAEKGATLEC
jgi:hypothetical protein